MTRYRAARLIPFVLAGAFTVAVVDRGEAAAILLSDVRVDVDDVALTASVFASLEAASDVVGDLFSLDGLNVNLSQDGALLDLLAGPTLVDDLPFFLDLPPTLIAGTTLPVSLLFRLTGLAAGATYDGSFAVLFSTDLGPDLSDPRVLSFSTAAPASVPEPATLLLMATGLGATGLLERRRRRRQAS